MDKIVSANLNNMQDNTTREIKNKNYPIKHVLKLLFESNVLTTFERIKLNSEQNLNIFPL